MLLLFLQNKLQLINHWKVKQTSEQYFSKWLYDLLLSHSIIFLWKIYEKQEGSLFKNKK